MPYKQPMAFRYLLFSSLLFLPALAGCNDAYEKDVRLGVLPEDSTGDTGGDAPSGDAPEDQDDDGLSDEVERTFELDSVVADTDHDNFSDGLEFVGNGGDPLDATSSPISGNRAIILSSSEARSSDPDTDQDGLGNAFETENNLDPENPDIDSDGYSDALELVAGSDPFSSDSRPVRNSPPVADGGTRGVSAPVDSDKDGLSDEIETLNGTDPQSRDTDTDGFSDGIEYLMGSDGTSILSVPAFDVPARPSTVE